MSDLIDKDSLPELLLMRATGELGPEQVERLRAALERDPALAAEAERLRRTIDLVALAARSEPPPELRARVLAAVPGAATAAPGAAPRAGRFRNWPFGIAASIAAASSLACAVLLYQGARERHHTELALAAASMLREPNVVMNFELEGAGGARGVVLLDLDAARASIALTGVAPPAPGGAYHLWALLDSKRVPCGQFTPQPDGTLTTQFPIPVDSYTAPIDRLVLTAETSADPLAEPAGAVVMTSL